MHCALVRMLDNLPARHGVPSGKSFWGESMKTRNSEEIVMMGCVRNLKFALVVCLAAVLLLFGSALTAQTFRGTILGTVTDSTGASIAGAAVAVKKIGRAHV